MPFFNTPVKNYGAGSWGLPDFGFTENFGGNQNSLSNANLYSQSGNNVLGGKSVLGMATDTPSAYSTPAGPTAPNNSNQSNKKKSSGGTNKTVDTGDSSLLQALDETYNDVMGGIGKQRSALQGNYGRYMDIARTPYDTAINSINQARNEAMGSIDAGINQTKQYETNALDAARRLYGELNTRNQQAFGSGMGSSVGQAASELLGREQARSFGDIRQQSSNQIADFNKQKTDLVSRANTQLQNLELQKGQALQRAELDYRDRLAQLDDMERQTRQSKAVDKLNLLKQFREEVRQTNMMAEQYRQQIKSQADLDASTIERAMQAYLSQAGGVMQGVTQGVNQFGADAGQTIDNLQANNAVTGTSGNVDPYAMLTGYRSNPNNLYDTFLNSGA